MKKTLLAHPLLRSVLLLLLALLVRPVMASHLLSGELTYRFVDASGPTNAPLRYEVTLTVYNNCNSSAIPPATTAEIGIYERSTGARIVMTSINYPTLLSGNISIPTQPLSACYTAPVPPGCAAPPITQPYITQKFVALVNLPNTTAGFYAVYTQGSRTSDIINLNNPGSQNMELYTTMAPPTIFNRSPVFASSAIINICTSDTTFYLNNAIDADGDELEYAFGQPYGGTTLPATTFTVPPPVVAYATTGAYSANTPFGVGRGIVNHLNNATGIATLATPVQGKYVVAIDVKEYRTINGVRTLIGMTRRDIQLVVAVCPTKSPVPTLPPPVQLPGSTLAPLPRAYTIEAGTSQTIAITATQRTSNSLSITATSELLDGAGGHDATLNGNVGTPTGLVGAATATGTGTVTGTFVFNSSCTEGRTQPYDIAIAVKDNGCSGQTIYDVFRITVVKPQGPTAVTGNLTVCGTGTTTSYTATGGTTAGVQWTVTGGTIVGSATANPVQVQWGAAGTGIITARGVSAAGCITDPVTQNVVVSAVPTLTITGNRSVCPGASTTLTVSGAATGTVYTITGGPVSGTSPTFVLTPTATTTYTVTAPSATGGCPITSQVTITVNPAVTANAGPAVSTTNGRPVSIGAAPVAGVTYSWSPTTGLSDPTSANPTVLLSNTTGAPITQTYTLTATNTATGCTGTASVVVSVGIDPNVEVANVITPNGDKMNDWLQIKNVASYPNNSMEIFNRWGRRVYSTTNYNNTSNYWGTDPGVMPGMYYYLFKQPNGAVTKGWVEVIK